MPILVTKNLYILLFTPLLPNVLQRERLVKILILILRRDHEKNFL